MKILPEQIEGGLWGLLVGDALGVPYEFHPPDRLPAIEDIEMVPTADFPRSYSHVPAGTWSDDGAQALCLAASLVECGGWNLEDFAGRLLRWRDQGYLAVDGKVFDIGNQTASALNRLAAGCPPDQSGLLGERNNGNGSLMRSLPIALLGPDEPRALVKIAHEQSAVTHAHPRSQACCAFYVLWALEETMKTLHPVVAATEKLLAIYAEYPDHAHELQGQILPSLAAKPGGTGYVVDSLVSTLAACKEENFTSVVRKAISFGHDTDTTACLAGGIAGIRHGLEGIPTAWLELVQSRARGSSPSWIMPANPNQSWSFSKKHRTG